jgi:hypothetical protein
MPGLVTRRNQQFPASVYSVSLISADREVSFSGADTTLNTIRC